MRARRPQGAPHRDLLLPARRPRQQQVRHVAAGDEQHEGHRSQEEHERRTQVAHVGLVQRLQGHALPGAAVGMLLGEAGGDPLHLGTRALDGDARLQAADDVDARVVAAVVLAADLVLEAQQRRVDVDGPPASVDGLGQNADHGEGLAAQDEVAAHHPGVAAEPALPVALGQDGHRLRPRLVVVGGEAPAEDGSLAQRREEAGRDLAAAQALRLRALRIEDEARAVVADQGLERGALVADVLQVRDGEAHLRDLLGPFGQEDQPVRLLVGKGAQEDRVDHAEDRGVGADAQGKGQDGHGGESGAPRQHARAVTDVLPPGFHRSSPPSAPRPSAIGRRRAYQGCNLIHAGDLRLPSCSRGDGGVR